MARGRQILQAELEAQIALIPRTLLVERLMAKLADAGRPTDRAAVERFAIRALAKDEPGAAMEMAQALGLGDLLTEEDAAELVKDSDAVVGEIMATIPALARDAAKRFAKGLWEDWPVHKQWEEETLGGFADRLGQRWGKGLDGLRILITACHELGDEQARRIRRRKRDPRLNEALLRLHARGCQVAREGHLLLANGFADGAMARWRTLHEISVVADLLRNGGEPLAVRYFDYEAVEAMRAMAKYEQSHVALGYKPLSASSKRKIISAFNMAVARHGSEFKGPNGWAAARLGIKRPTFQQLEEATGLAKMRSHYEMASHNVHAAPKGVMFRLGQLEESSVFLAGPSNAGLANPGNHIAAALVHLTVTLLDPPRSLDAIIDLAILIELRDGIETDLSRADRRLRHDDRALTRPKLTRNERHRA